MNFLTILTTFLPSILQLVEAIPQIKTAWDAAPKNSLSAVAAAVEKALPASLVNQLAEAGSQLFPKLSPELHAAAAALIVAHPNSISFAQSALNILESTGYLNFGAPLVVDGIFGSKTMAAVEALQAKAGLPVTGFVADAEYQVITQLLGKV